MKCPMVNSAKQSRTSANNWIASSLSLLAMTSLIRPSDRLLDPSDDATVDVGNPCDTGKGHAHIELVAQNLDCARDTGLPAGAEAVEIRAPAQARARAERDGAHEILTGADAAIEQNFDG